MKEVWATYSVRDHLAPKAFVADVMLYDCLVIPVPIEGDEAHWKDWDIGRQKAILKILGKRAVQVPWSLEWQRKWKSEWEAAKAVGLETSQDAFRMTPTVLLESIPRTVTGVVAVATFHSPEEMRSALRMREVIVPPNSRQPLLNHAGGPLAAVIGRDFLVPDDAGKSEEYLLQTAVNIADDVRFQRKRAAYWRWQREFLSDCTVLDQRALDDAALEMEQLIEEEKAEVRKSNAVLRASFLFAAGACAVGIFTPPLTPLALASGFLSIGAWAIDHIPEYLGVQTQAPKPSAMCVSAQREFGWTGHS